MSVYTVILPIPAWKQPGFRWEKSWKFLICYRSRLDAEIFTTPPANPEHKTPEQSRENLKQAVKLLKEAGYDFKDGKMINLKDGTPLTLEIIDNSANGKSFTRVMLPFINNLKKIGIDAIFEQ